MGEAFDGEGCEGGLGVVRIWLLRGKGGYTSGDVQSTSPNTLFNAGHNRFL